MKIIQDTREQNPLIFIDPLVTNILVEKLDCGDYGCEFKGGYRPPVYFERKSLEDLFGTMGSGYKRFKKEINRNLKRGTALILLIERPLSEIYRGSKFSTLAGPSVVKKLFTLWWKYHLYPVFCSNREECSNFIIEYYGAIGRQAIRDTKLGKN